ncbi:MAG: pilus assembly protein [Acidobacteriaceae bacterium]|nr:pilus assembly protein [Acidobacteriaceae bacterium]
MSAKRFLERLVAGTESTNGAAIVEFAVALPLLIVLVVGIFDFGGAFNIKQELGNAMREAARFGAAQPTNDLRNGGTPPSVDAIRYLVDSYLVAARINDCGLGGVGVPGGGPPWVYTANGNGCAGTLTLTINRGVVLPETVAGTAINLLATQVSISYPYQWRFNNALHLISPGSTFALANIPADATAVNQD